MLSSSLSRPSTNLVAKIPVASISFNNSEAEERLFHFDKSISNSVFNFLADYDNNNSDDSGNDEPDRESSNGHNSFTRIITPTIPNSTFDVEDNPQQPTKIKLPSMFPDFPQHQPIVINGTDSDYVDIFSKSGTPDLQTPITVSPLFYSKNDQVIKSSKENRVAAKLNRVPTQNELFQFANDNQSERSYNDIMNIKKRPSKSAATLRTKPKEPLQLLINNTSPNKTIHVEKAKFSTPSKTEFNSITPKFKTTNFESSLKKFERVKTAGSNPSPNGTLSSLNLTSPTPIIKPNINLAPKISLAMPLRNNESLRRNYSAGALK